MLLSSSLSMSSSPDSQSCDDGYVCDLLQQIVNEALAAKIKRSDMICIFFEHSRDLLPLSEWHLIKGTRGKTTMTLLQSQTHRLKPFRRSQLRGNISRYQRYAVYADVCSMLLARSYTILHPNMDEYGRISLLNSIESAGHSHPLILASASETSKSLPSSSWAESMAEPWLGFSIAC